jgi:type I restriction enzyme, S subunit
MSKWEEKRLEDIIDVNPPVKLKKGESYPFIDIDKVSPTRRSVTNEEVKVYDGQSSSKFCDGDTVFSRITPCLENRKIAKVAIEGDAAFGSTEFYVFRAKKKKADARFTYYLASSDAVVLPAINSMTGASGRQRADKRFIQRLKLNLPDLPTQERIADILSAYDDLIEVNNRRIELLEQAAQELYKEWFVRFRFPGYENAKFEDGIPEGWKIKRINEFCYVTDGTHDTPKPVDIGVPLVTGRCISSGFVDFDATYNISETDHEGIKKRSGLKSGDILFSNIGTVGNCCIVDYNCEFSVKNVIIFKPKTMRDTAYLYYWMTSSTMQEIFGAQTNGASQQFVGLTFMRRYKLLAPKDDILEAFVDKVLPIVEQKRLLHQKNLNLAAQRDMLLQRLMSGKLEV